MYVTYTIRAVLNGKKNTGSRLNRAYVQSSLCHHAPRLFGATGPRVHDRFDETSSQCKQPIKLDSRLCFLNARLNVRYFSTFAAHLDLSLIIGSIVGKFAYNLIGPTASAILNGNTIVNHLSLC